MVPFNDSSDTAPRWEFDRKRPSDTQSEPITGELFSGEALEAPASALVRETIQNSLDARAGAELVRVRFTIPSEPALLGFDSLWLAGLQPHLGAERNGLVTKPSDRQAFSTLLIEDYGTFGLPGDVAQTNDTAEAYRGRKNHFFYFWRAIGSSGKDSTERGSWGLGKSVLPATSSINTFFGVSCQEPDAELRLLGLSVLRYHNLPEDADGQEPFTPYGRFGCRLQSHGAAMPINDPAEVAAFCRDFGVNREGQPGLSLVVIEPQITISHQVLIVAAIVHYFYPIIEGQLVVEVVDGDRITVINSETIAECARQHERGLDQHRLEPTIFQEMLELARRSVEDRRQRALRLNEPKRPAQPTWDDCVFEVEGWKEAAGRFMAGTEVEFAIPMRLTPKQKAEQSVEFYVCMKKLPESERGKILYLRNGITISGITELSGTPCRPVATDETIHEPPSNSLLTSALPQRDFYLARNTLPHSSDGSVGAHADPIVLSLIT